MQFLNSTLSLKPSLNWPIAGISMADIIAAARLVDIYLRDVGSCNRERQLSRDETPTNSGPSQKVTKPDIELLTGGYGKVK